MPSSSNPSAAGLAIVTGASSGIGLELARLAVQDGFDLLIAADRGDLEATAAMLRAGGRRVDVVKDDLANKEGVEALVDAVGGRPVELLFANAGHGLGGAFLDQQFDDITHVLDTNVTGTIYLVHAIGRRMRASGSGKIMFTGSISGFQPGAFAAVYNATKAFVDSFSAALRNELKDSGVSVTCLMPGVTDTEFFERAGMLDTKVGASENKMDPAKVARIGYDAMMDGEADVVAGLKNKAMVAMSKTLPSQAVAEMHRKQAEPGSAPG